MPLNNFCEGVSVLMVSSYVAVVTDLRSSSNIDPVQEMLKIRVEILTFRILRVALV